MIKNIENLRALILAGGRGTRLSDVVRDVPKSIAPIRGIPFLRYQIEILKSAGIKKITLLTGYMSEIIEEYFKDGGNLGIEIGYSDECSPLGTGGAVKAAMQNSQEENFLILNGDCYFTFCLKDFLSKAQSPCTIGLVKMKHAERYGIAEINGENFITSFREKKRGLEDSLVNSGIYFMTKEVLGYFAQKKENFYSLETEIFPAIIEENNLYSVICEGDFIDIGIPEDYKISQRKIPDLLSCKMP